MQGKKIDEIVEKLRAHRAKKLSWMPGPEAREGGTKVDGDGLEGDGELGRRLRGPEIELADEGAASARPPTQRATEREALTAAAFEGGSAAPGGRRGSVRTVTGGSGK